MIVRRLKDTREDLDLTQEKIGKTLNVDKTTVSGWETGKDTIPLRKLIIYCNKFEFTLDYIFGLTRTNTYRNPITIDLNKIGNNIKNISSKIFIKIFLISAIRIIDTRKLIVEIVRNTTVGTIFKQW